MVQMGEQVSADNGRNQHVTVLRASTSTTAGLSATTALSATTGLSSTSGSRGRFWGAVFRWVGFGRALDRSFFARRAAALRRSARSRRGGLRHGALRGRTGDISIVMDTILDHLCTLLGN